MTTTNNQAKTYTVTAYEFSVLVRALLETMKAQNVNLTDRFRPNAPWESVLSLISEAQIEAVKEAQASGEFDKLLENFKTQQTIKNN